VIASNFDRLGDHVTGRPRHRPGATVVGSQGILGTKMTARS